MAEWNARDFQGFSERAKEQLRAQGVDVDGPAKRNGHSNPPAMNFYLEPLPTNKFLFAVGWTLVAAGATVRWLGQVVTTIGAGLFRAGQAIRDHAEHKVQ